VEEKAAAVLVSCWDEHQKDYSKTGAQEYMQFRLAGKKKRRMGKELIAAPWCRRAAALLPLGSRRRGTSGLGEIKLAPVGSKITS
jgi:hypothetical protein